MKNLIQRMEKEIEEVSIAIGGKAEGVSPHLFWHEIEIPTLLKEEMKKKEKNVTNVSC